MKVDPRREPLDPQERILADALARQPAIEPPAMLDARVLAQARAALQAQAPARRHPRPWWLSATLGTAAAAVLAAGLAWQAGLFDIGYGSSVPVPRSRAPLAESAETRTAVDIDLRHRAAQPPSRSEAETLREESAAAALPSAPPPAPPAPRCRDDSNAANSAKIRAGTGGAPRACAAGPQRHGAGRRRARCPPGFRFAHEARSAGRPAALARGCKPRP